MMTPDERYHRDALFRTMVDQLEFYVREAVFSGTEIREAAMLALIHYESTRIDRRWLLSPDGHLEAIAPLPPVRPGMREVNTLHELREAVAQGAGHACMEWFARGQCVLCDRPDAANAARELEHNP